MLFDNNTDSKAVRSASTVVDDRWMDGQSYGKPLNIN